MHTLAILLLVSPIAHAEPAHSQCDFTHVGSRTTINGTRSDRDDDSSTSFTFVNSDHGHCTSATIVGNLKYSDAEDDVIDMPFGGHAVFRERTTSDDRELTITRGPSGELLHLYRHNSANAPYDSDARRWLADFLPTVLMESGVNVGPRVARWRAQGGVDNVLAHIGDISSSGAKRAHYERLLAGERLTNADLDKIVRHAGRNVQSSGDLRAVLERAAPSRGGAMRSASALEEAAAHIASSGDRTAVLQRYAETSDREMLLAVMRVARTIPSSGDKANLLRQMVSHYLDGNDHELGAAFFQTAATVPSSGDLRNVLDSALPYAGKSADQALMLIETARIIASSGDRAEILIGLVHTGVLSTAKVRDAFIDAATSVASSGDRSRVLEAAARRQ